MRIVTLCLEYQYGLSFQINYQDVDGTDHAGRFQHLDFRAPPRFGLQRFSRYRSMLKDSHLSLQAPHPPKALLSCLCSPDPSATYRQACPSDF